MNEDSIQKDSEAEHSVCDQLLLDAVSNQSNSDNNEERNSKLIVN